MRNRVPTLSELLTLTSIEQYHLADDRPQYPNVIACDLLVAGSVDRDIATLALRAAARDHLLICARLQRPAWRRPRWKIDECQADELNWQKLPSYGEHPGGLACIDLDQGFPGQFWWGEEPERTRLSFRTHHAAMDGGGGLQIVIDWMLHYQRISAGADLPRARRVDSGLLRRRNHLRLFTREFIGKLWIQPIAVLGASKFLFRRVTSLAQVADGNTNSATGPAGESRLMSASLNNDQLQRLKQQANDRSATVNVLVLAAVFRALHQLRKRHGWYEEREWLRLVIPISIRDFADRRLPAANRATMVQLDRTDRDLEDPDGLVWGINHELGNIRDWNLEKTILLALKWMSLVPGWIRWIAGRPVCRATSVVTNLGAPLERVKLDRDDQGRLITGNLVIDDVQLTVPIRPRTPAGFAVVRYANRQNIDLHFDPGQIEPLIAAELLDLTVRNLTGEPLGDPE